MFPEAKYPGPRNCFKILKIPEYVHFVNDPRPAIDGVLKRLSPDRTAYLVDENTRAKCLPALGLAAGRENIIEIKSGEIHKNLDTCRDIWDAMTRIGLGRSSVLVNLGGGVIGDMGGFAASTYKRGIRFVNVPTTLLAAVDANIGGKLGIDFQGFKNHIGAFNDPASVIVSDIFLRTLPPRELKSGFAEVIKHGLIYDKGYYQSISTTDYPAHNWLEVIQKSVAIKGEVTRRDPKEKGLRKILNFGHTLGHGIETWHLKNGKSLLHGEAISIGMILEAFLAHKLDMTARPEVDDVASYIKSVFGKFDLPPIEEILPLMLQDKKNTGNEINFSLLQGIGKCSFDVKADLDRIGEAFRYYEAV